MSRHTGFVFTSYAEERPDFSHPFIRHAQCVRETCPETKRLHWQCAILTDQMTRSAAYKYFPGVAWDAFQDRKGTFEQARVYCTIGKGRDPPDTTGVPGTEFECGERPRPGQRNDLRAAAAGILSKGWSGVEDHMIVKYNRGLSFLLAQRKRVEREVKGLHWVWGPDPEKVLDRVSELLGPGPAYNTHTIKWFTHYDGEYTLTVRFDPQTMGESEIAPLISSQPYLADGKNSHVWVHPQKIIFYSHNRPDLLVSERIWRQFTVHMVGGTFITPPTS